MPIQGFVRLRKHQFGRQQDFGTAVAATRAYPHSGTPDRDLGWTDPDVDVGSRDPVSAPYKGPSDLSANLTSSALCYNDIIKIFSGFFGGAEVPTGGGVAQTWTFDPASTTVDEIDPYTYEFGDDVLTDWDQLGDGIITDFEISGPEGLGVLTSSETWRFGSYASSGSTDLPDNPTVPTPGLSVAINDAYIYLKDGAIYIDSDASDIFNAANKISDALHTFTLRGTQEVDDKRFANGDQSFDIDAYGPGKRGIELECTWAKTADTVGLGSESDAWTSDTSINRYVGLRFISKVLAESPSTFYSLDISFPMRYYTRTEGEVGGNTTVILTGHAFDDEQGSGAFGGVFNAVVVNTLTEAELGLIGS
jgi:hypothetical protein